MTPESDNFPDSLAYRFRFEKLILQISSRFNNLTLIEIDDGINDVLRMIGEFERVDRSYFFQFEDDGVTFNNTHEWCNEGVRSERARLTNLTVHDLPWVMEKLTRGETVHIPRVEDLPFEAFAEKKEFIREGNKSLINVPTILAGRVVGFLGFDSVGKEKTWPDDSIALLRIVGEIFANAVERRRVELALRKANEELENRVALRTKQLAESNELLASEIRSKSEEITQRIKTEEALRKSEERYREFIATVSHELRTPLTSIHGSLSAIRSGIGGPIPSKVLELVEIGVSNSSRLIRHINDFLDLEKMQLGKIDFRKQDVDLADNVKQAVETNRSYADKYKVTFVLEAPELQKMYVHVDPDRLIQVITNLLSNAAKHSPRDSQVLVQVSRYKDCGRVSVKDKGEGIPENFRARIFQKFATADPGKSGTGLGLSISKWIIEQMGGSIDFESTPSSGSTFYFDLPLVH